MIVFYSENTGVEISGSDSELLFLAQEIAEGAFIVETSIEDIDPAPYEKCLQSILIKTTPGEKVNIQVDSNDLIINGSRENLALLAEAIKNFTTNKNLGKHTHIEYFDDHFFLSSIAIPLVVARS